MKVKRWLKISLILLIFVVGGAVFYFKYPQIWGSAVYPLEYEDLILKYAKQYNIPPSFIAAVIYSESHFNKDATSPVGASGLMQIMPATGARLAKTLGDTDFAPSKLFEPERNVRYGSYYLKELIDRHEGDVDKALMAYNGGEAAVISYERNSVLPRETSGYVRKVKGTWEMYEKVYADKWQAQKNQETAKQQENQEQKQLQKDIHSRQAMGEELKINTVPVWNFKIFWPVNKSFQIIK